MGLFDFIKEKEEKQPTQTGVGSTLFSQIKTPTVPSFFERNYGVDLTKQEQGLTPISKSATEIVKKVPEYVQKGKEVGEALVDGFVDYFNKSNEQFKQTKKFSGTTEAFREVVRDAAFSLSKNASDYALGGSELAVKGLKKIAENNNWTDLQKTFQDADDEIDKWQKGLNQAFIDNGFDISQPGFGKFAGNMITSIGIIQKIKPSLAMVKNPIQKELIAGVLEATATTGIQELAKENASFSQFKSDLGPQIILSVIGDSIFEGLGVATRGVINSLKDVGPSLKNIDKNDIARMDDIISKTKDFEQAKQEIKELPVLNKNNEVSTIGKIFEDIKGFRKNNVLEKIKEGDRLYMSDDITARERKLKTKEVEDLYATEEIKLLIKDLENKYPVLWKGINKDYFNTRIENAQAKITKSSEMIDLYSEIINDIKVGRLDIANQLIQDYLPYNKRITKENIDSQLDRYNNLLISHNDIIDKNIARAEQQKIGTAEGIFDYKDNSIGLFYNSKNSDEVILHEFSHNLHQYVDEKTFNKVLDYYETEFNKQVKKFAKSKNDEKYVRDILKGKDYVGMIYGQGESIKPKEAAKQKAEMAKYREYDKLIKDKLGNDAYRYQNHFEFFAEELKDGFIRGFEKKGIIQQIIDFFKDLMNSRKRFFDKLSKEFKKGPTKEKLQKLSGNRLYGGIPPEETKILGADVKIKDTNLEAGLPKTPEAKEKIVDKKMKEKVYERGAFSETINDIVVPLSTRLKDIGYEFYDAIKDYEFNVLEKKIEYSNLGKDFIEKMQMKELEKKLSKQEIDDFFIALYSSNAEKINTYLKKLGLEDAYSKVRVLYDDVIIKDAKEVGINLKKKGGYNAREVKDYDGLMKFLKKKYGGLSSIIQRELVRRGGIDLSKEEQVEIINSMLMGRPKSEIFADKISYEKADKELKKILGSSNKLGKKRTILEIDPEMLKFYYNPADSLINYISRNSRAIEQKKFFGKGDNLEDQIGNYVAKYLEKGNLSVAQERELRKLLQGYFAPMVSSESTKILKDITYITTLGDITPALTNLEDLALTVVESGFGNTLKASLRGMFGKGEGYTSAKKMGFDSAIEEFKEDGIRITKKVLDKVFKLNFFSKTDQSMKTLFLNSQIEYLKNLKKTNPKFLDKKVREFMGDKTDDLIKEIDKGADSKLIRSYLFRKLSSSQPISPSEMPFDYLTGDKSQLLYALKSFQIKRVDWMRREIWRKLSSGEGVKNALGLATGLMLIGYSNDTIKDLLLNRNQDTKSILNKDRATDQLLKFLTLSKYYIYVARNNEDGIGAGIIEAMGRMYAPAIYGIGKDVLSDGNQYLLQYLLGNISKDDIKLESTKYVPLVGKGYYWWFGKGASKEEIALEKNELYKELDERNKRKVYTEKIITKIKNTKNQKEKKKLLKEYIQKYPGEENVKYLINKTKKGVIPERYKVLETQGISSGTRAESIYKRLNTLKTNKEKFEYISDLKKYNLLGKNDEVLKQVLDKIKKGQQ